MILRGSSEGSIVIVLNKGDKLVENLTHLMTQHGVKGGLISGVGALKEVELGYYELENKTYLRKTFQEEDYELLSLNGNITLKDNAPYIHVHAVLGKSNFSTFGGHLFEAVVAVTAEITVIPLGKMPR
ncbi:MAG: DNA-binding protein, partial [Legionellaceae bacterium]|nr:DNA-binding protein [Legionellaceae bacterium]